MKKQLLLALSLVVVLLLLPISVSGSGPAFYIYKLIAAQHYQAGEIKVWVEGDTLKIRFADPGFGCCLTETHVAVAQTLEGIPQNQGGPIPGHFPYSREYDPPECGYDVPYEIPLDGLEPPFIIAAHAQVICDFSEDEETGWGARCGTLLPFPDARKWTSYMVYPP